MSKLITELYKSRNILLDQLLVQGYDTKDYVGVSLQEINIMSNQGGMDMLIKKKETNKKIYIKYLCCDSKQITIKTYDNVVEELFNENNDDDNNGIESTINTEDTLMIISMQDINDSLTQRIKESWEMRGYFVIINNLYRLQYNVLNHDLVPKHEVIYDSLRLNEIKAKYYIDDDDKFPTISRFDPIAIAIGIRPGELCEITRPSKTAITTPYYRICINL